MEFPHRHHGHGRRDDDDRRRQPPPAGYGHEAPPPPYGHEAPPPPYGYGQPPPPDPYGAPRPHSYAPPPPSYGSGGGGYGNVVHVSHEVPDQHGPQYGGGGGSEYISPVHGGHASGGGAPGSEYISPAHEGARPHHGGGGAPPVRQQTYRIYCKAGEDNYSLAARDGKTNLIPLCLKSQICVGMQHWVKDMKYSTRVKDEEGYPAMALVNKATGEALKHSLGQSHPVRLARYNSEYMDESVLWTESRDVGGGFRCIRMVNNIYLNFDALHGDKDHGGVRDGTTLVLWEWCEGDNQRWKIVPWCKSNFFFFFFFFVLLTSS
uniref:Ricin B lectin domain-containing protein n=1 Tax=Leersia perrieri TaxID=77586 RepID=A0A0D9UVT1_9ORYZ